jgi:hypothetical protein
MSTPPTHLANAVSAQFRSYSAAELAEMLARAEWAEAAFSAEGKAYEAGMIGRLASIIRRRLAN